MVMPRCHFCRGPDTRMPCLGQRHRAPRAKGQPCLIELSGEHLAWVRLTEVRSLPLGLGPRGHLRAAGTVNYPAPGTIQETGLAFEAEGTVTRQSVSRGSPSCNCCVSSPPSPGQC